MPGNPCCCSCEICEDDFENNSSGSDITGGKCALTVESGTWSISSELGNERLKAESNDAYVKINQSIDDSARRLMVSPAAWDEGDTIRILFDYVDTDNYLAAEFIKNAVPVPPNGIMRIIRRTSGSETILQEKDFGAQTFGTSTPTACYEPADQRFTCQVFNGSTYGVGNHTLMAYEEITNHAIAFGVKTLDASSFIEFNSITLEKSSTGDCPDCPECEGCQTTNPLNEEIQVVLAGLSNQDCGSCTSLNTTYLLQRFAHRRCAWRYAFPSTTCGFNYLWFFINKDNSFPPFRSRVVRLSPHNDPDITTGTITFGAAAQTTDYNCTAFNYTSTGVNDQSTQCVGAGATATVTVPA